MFSPDDYAELMICIHRFWLKMERGPPSKELEAIRSFTQIYRVAVHILPPDPSVPDLDLEQIKKVIHLFDPRTRYLFDKLLNADITPDSSPPPSHPLLHLPRLPAFMSRESSVLSSMSTSESEETTSTPSTGGRTIERATPGATDRPEDDSSDGDETDLSGPRQSSSLRSQTRGKVSNTEENPPVKRRLEIGDLAYRLKNLSSTLESIQKERALPLASLQDQIETLQALESLKPKDAEWLGRQHAAMVDQRERNVHSVKVSVDVGYICGEVCTSMARELLYKPDETPEEWVKTSELLADILCLLEQKEQDAEKERDALDEHKECLESMTRELASARKAYGLV